MEIWLCKLWVLKFEDEDFSICGGIDIGFEVIVFYFFNLVYLEVGIVYGGSIFWSVN